MTAHSGHHLQDALERAHLLHHPHLLEIVFIGEGGLFELLFELEALLFVEILLAFLTRLITSPMPRIRSAIERGLKTCKSPTLLANPFELQRLLRHFPDRDRSSCSRIASRASSKLCRYLHPLVEFGGRLHRILACRRIGDKEDFARLQAASSSLRALASALHRDEAVRRIDDQDIVSFFLAFS